MGKLTRRAAIRGAGSIVLASSLPHAAYAREKADVVVLGAGLSGLNTAYILADHGAKVIVLEAGDRVGGRCYTPDLPGLEGYGIEFGASQVGVTYARVLETINRLGIHVGDGSHIIAPYCFAIDGKVIALKDWASSPLNKLTGDDRDIVPTALIAQYTSKYTPFRALDDWRAPAAKVHDISMGDWLLKQGASQEVIRLANEGLIAPDVWSVSALRTLQEHFRSSVQAKAPSGVGEDKNKDIYENFAANSFHIKGGTQRLPEAMAADLGDVVRFGKQAVSIDMTSTSATVECIDRTTYSCDYVVSAIPFTALRNLTIRPHLTGHQAEAVRLMPYSNNSQLFFRVKGEPYWEKDGLEASMWTDGPLSLVRQQIGNDGEREIVEVLGVGVKGDRLDEMAWPERAQFVEQELYRLRPAMKGTLELVTMNSWGDMRYIEGCSHSYYPGRAHDWTTSMSKPHSRLHFAGEHTRQLEVGMESAMESGERAALEILEKA